MGKYHCGVTLSSERICSCGNTAEPRGVPRSPASTQTCTFCSKELAVRLGRCGTKQKSGFSLQGGCKGPSWRCKKTSPPVRVRSGAGGQRGGSELKIPPMQSISVTDGLETQAGTVIPSPSRSLSYFLEKENRVNVKSQCDSWTLLAGAGEDVGQWEPHSALGGRSMEQPLWKTVWQFLAKVRVLPPCDSAVTLLGSYPNELRTQVPIKPSAHMLIAASIIIAQTWEQPRCPSLGEWINTLLYSDYELLLSSEKK